MTTGQLLDKLLSTSDKGFTSLIQAIIAQNTGPGKFFPEEHVLDYMQLLYNIYYFCLKNNKKPYACIDYILTEADSRNYSDESRLLLFDSILRIIVNSSKWDMLELIQHQIMDIRHNIKPFVDDLEIKNFCPEFNYDLLKDELQNLNNPDTKIELLKERLRLLDEKWNSLNEYEQIFVEDSAFAIKCVNEIERQQDAIHTSKGEFINGPIRQIASTNREAQDHPLPVLPIPPASRQALYNDLKEYVECDAKGNYPELKALIFDNTYPSKPIVVTCEVQEFGAIFYETGAVPRGWAEALSQVLPKLFVRNNGKGIVKFSSQFLVKTLRPGKKTQ